MWRSFVNGVLLGYFGFRKAGSLNLSSYHLLMIGLLSFFLSGSFSFLINPKPPHFGQISMSSESLSNLPLPLHLRQKSIPYFCGSKVSSMSVLKPPAFNASIQWTVKVRYSIFLLLVFLSPSGFLIACFRGLNSQRFLRNRCTSIPRNVPEDHKTSPGS